MVVVQRVVKRLHFGRWKEKEEAAEEITRLAKGESNMRKSLAELGVVPPLVAMAGGGRSEVAVRALFELSNENYTNKALMVEAGMLLKLPENVNDLGESVRCDLCKLLLSVSSLANSRFPLTSPKMFPFLLAILESNSSAETKNSCLSTLLNLSTMLDQSGNLVTDNVIHTLLNLSSIKQTSEKSLAILANLVVTLQGKKALENHPMIPESLIEILMWEEEMRCQELSAYILMILAHRSSAQREKMATAGITPVLVEVALLGSTLAQKRALKLLQWFKNERISKVGPHSGPQARRLAIGSPLDERAADEGKAVMKKLVKQSLYKNLETITRRANVDKDSPTSSKFKALIISTSSKSLPY